MVFKKRKYASLRHNVQYYITQNWIHYIIIMIMYIECLENAKIHVIKSAT